MTATLHAIDGPDISNQPPSVRQSLLLQKRVVALTALEIHLKKAGLINRYAGHEGYTDLHRLFVDFETACYCESHLDKQLTRLRRQMENVISTDAYSDPDARRAVLTTVNRLGGKRQVDGLSLTAGEAELLAHYRSMNGSDRALLRSLLQRLGVELSVDGEPASRESVGGAR